MSLLLLNGSKLGCYGFLPAATPSGQRRSQGPSSAALNRERRCFGFTILVCRLSSRLVREAEEQLRSWIHPDPWVNPYMPGGSRFMRNPAMPLSVSYLLPNDEPCHTII